ncbi:MAG: serine/threonine-protein kinase [Chloroflexi bacterium]|nr:MAG: serine/threonine-protein kinase [Chloroflexota bacterium]
MNLPPETLLNNRYRIDRMLGQGGMGAVYLALDTALDALVAVKANQNPAPQSSTQFLREARLLASLRHPNLPRVTDYFILNDSQYLVMDYVAGKDLNAILQEEGAQPLERVLAWASELCNALSYLHGQKPPVIHRDIKPANVRLSSEGEVILVDFGIAKVYDPDQQTTTTGAMGYTPGYAPPEQYGGSVRTGPYTDQYSLAALLYHLLSGQKPADSVQRAIGSVRLAPLGQIRPDVPAHVQATIERALSLRPDERFSGVDDFIHALESPALVPAEHSDPTVLPARMPETPPPNAQTAAGWPPEKTTASAAGLTARSAPGSTVEPIQAPAHPTRRGPRKLLVSAIVIMVFLGLASVVLMGGGFLLFQAGQPATRVAVAATTAPDATATGIASTSAAAVKETAYTGSVATAAAATIAAARPAETLTLAASDTPAPASTPTLELSPTVLPTNTSQPTPLPPTFGGGGLLAFSSNRGDGQTFQIWTMRVAQNDQGGMVTSELKQITSGPGDKTQPAWSPDGKHLIYVAPGGPDQLLDLWMINPDGSGEPKDLTNMKGNETEPAWSPDGRWIAFTSDKWTGNVQQIYLVRPDGSDTYRLSYDQREYGSSWKPDNQLTFIMDTGMKIVFIRGQKDPKTGAAPTREYYVTPYRFDTMSFTDNLGDAIEPAWAPDGKSLAYSRVRGNNRNISLALYPFKIPSHDVIKLTDTGKDTSPAWSPDGQWIVFTSTREGNAEVYIMRNTGQSQINISNDSNADKDPAWQPEVP